MFINIMHTVYCIDQVMKNRLCLHIAYSPSDSHNNSKLGLGGDVEVSSLACLAGHADILSLLGSVFLHILLCTLEYHLLLLLEFLHQQKTPMVNP